MRRAGPTDLDGVVACQTTCWEQTYRGVVPDSYLDAADVEELRRERWRARLAGSREVFLAEAGTAVVGVASAVSGPEPPGRELKSIYVQRSWHGSGVADGLLAAAIRTGPARVWLFTSNERARRFYARHGFRATGVEQVDPDTGVPEMLMARTPITTVDGP